jgi:hypothetical protein
VWWLGILLLAAIGAAVARSRGLRLLPAGDQKLLPGATDAMASWAEDNGWTVYEGDDKQIRGEANTLFAMAGPPSLEALYALQAQAPRHQLNEPVAYFSATWEATAVLERDTAEGPQTLIGATANYGGSRAVIASIGTKGTIGQFGLDAFGWPVEIRASGEPPENIDFDKVLAGFGTPLRLRFAEGTLLLRVPGALTPDLADTVLERLEGVRDQLPRRPDLGPQR